MLTTGIHERTVGGGGRSFVSKLPLLRVSHLLMLARIQIVGLLVVAVVGLGCSRGPARIDAPDIDVEAAADQAMELYDVDANGSLDGKELTKCPGIFARIAQYDQNGDKLIDRNEISGRLNELFKHQVGLTQLRSRVSFRGEPLANAKVMFEPESYLGTEVKAAEGTTNPHGSAQMSISAEELPENVRDMKLVQYGTYKVRITHPTVKLPPKYNTETTLGYETLAGNPFAVFSLKP